MKTTDLTHSVEAQNRFVRILQIILAVIAVPSFVLSFTALKATAADGGKAELLSWMWPVIIDLPILSLSLLAFYLHKYHPARKMGIVVAHVLTISAVILTAWFNYRYAAANGYDVWVFVAAPVAFALMVEIALYGTHINSQREGVIFTLLKLKEEVQKLRVETKTLTDSIEAKQRLLDETTDSAKRLEDETRQRAKKILQSANAEAEAILQRAKAKSFDLSGFKINMTPDERRGAVALASHLRLPQSQQAAAFGVSESTIKNDKSHFTNGKLNH